MREVMIIGAGRMGSVIASMLLQSNSYSVHLVNHDWNLEHLDALFARFPLIKRVTMDATAPGAIEAYVQQNNISAVFCALSSDLIQSVVCSVANTNAHYFDLTGDVVCADLIQALAKDKSQAFVPLCGLAPGLVGLVGYHIMQEFDQVSHVRLYQGGLPQQVSNQLYHSLTWSTEDLINSYTLSCCGLREGKLVALNALGGLEVIPVDGLQLEAFYSARGLGNLPIILADKVGSLDYKMLRYPGHCEKIRFMRDTLRLDEDPELFQRLLERAMPRTTQDLVVIYVSIEGMRDGQWVEKSYVKQIHPQVIDDMDWSAKQIGVGSMSCAVLDMVLNEPDKYHGFVAVETLDYLTVLGNRFGQYLR